MVLEYFSRKKGKEAAPTAVEEPKSPVLKEEDEAFLQRLTAEAIPDPNTALVIVDNGTQLRGKDAQEALMDGANTVPLPSSPPAVEETKEGDSKKKSGKRNYWNYIQTKVPNLPFGKDSDKNRTGDQLHTVASSVKTGESLAPPPVVVSSEEVEKEKEDLTAVLDQLSLASVNNRAFSFSKESQRLMDDFTQVLKDLINGVPTAYDDLEKLLTNSENQLQGMFDGLPPFLQKLVKSLPAKVTSSIAPGLAAAASEKPGADGIKMGLGEAASSSKLRIPSLKKLVAQQGAVTGLLRSILNFLKLRFPAALTGTNVLLSLAVFLLLFVFWYCHKRGRETRLEKERLAADGPATDGSVSGSDIDDSIILDKDEPVDPEVARVEEILKKPAPTSAPRPQ